MIELVFIFFEDVSILFLDVYEQSKEDLWSHKRSVVGPSKDHGVLRVTFLIYKVPLVRVRSALQNLTLNQVHDLNAFTN